jgi:sulfur carrier protein
MLRIYLNDEVHHTEPTGSLQDFLIREHLVEQHFAVAINNQHVPRMAYATTMLNTDDRVDIIVPMQGG